jgi:hypothetical protein
VDGDSGQNPGAQVPGPQGSDGRPRAEQARGDYRDPALLRVCDADRDRVATELSEHFQAGRLNQDEFDERVGQAINARTQGDLDTLLTDLPAARRPGRLPAAAGGSRPARGRLP